MTTGLVYQSQSAWEAQENTEFQDIIKEMGSFGNAQQAYLFLAAVLLPFMGNFFESQSEYPTNAMNNISNVDLYDIQQITNSYDQVYEAAVGGINVWNEDGGLSSNFDQYSDDVQKAYEAANNLLVDVYTNSIFDGTEIPSQVQGDLETIFGSSDIQKVPISYTIDSQQIDGKMVPQFVVGPDQVEDTLKLWAGSEDANGNPLQPGDSGLQEWAAASQKIQSELQNLTTLFTDESSTEQSEVNFYNGESKIYSGSMNGDLRDITSQEKTAVQNEISR